MVVSARHGQVARVASPPVTRSHTRLWEPCFLVCPISYVSTLPRFAVRFNYTKQILKESFGFSQMMDVFSLYSVTRESEVRASQRDPLDSSQQQGLGVAGTGDLVEPPRSTEGMGWRRGSRVCTRVCF